ncbi:MAG: DUF4268 domain-containing protein [Spirochaetaceae bacterium]|nr:DUF4268 domain-containing protein [Spirochaetaceae bacterium]
MQAQEQEIVYLDVRKEWKHEALNFTPWLARNLGALGKILGMELKCDQTEAQVGQFSCDILATEVDSGAKVTIENQLELSDHGHLGQLLTYAADLGALIAVWVAPEFCYEHAQALDNLNKWTHNNVRFYGIRVTLRRIGKTPAKPHFETVVTPTHWNKTITQKKGDTPPLKKQYGDFFEPLVTRLNGSGFAEKALFHYGPSGRVFPSRIDPGIGYAATLEEREHAWVGLHIQTHDNNLNKQVFDMLAQDQERIESSIDLRPGEEWCWYRHSPFTYSSINLRSAGALHDQPEKLMETRTWMHDMLRKLKRVLEPRLEVILEGLQVSGGG